jgi:hypothetical protein
VFLDDAGKGSIAFVSSCDSKFEEYSLSAVVQDTSHAFRLSGYFDLNGSKALRAHAEDNGRVTELVVLKAGSCAFRFLLEAEIDKADSYQGDFLAMLKSLRVESNQ